jgi:hypothetical protein
LTDILRSFCKMELSVEDMKSISKMENQLDSPPLVVLALSMKTVLNHNTNSNEIVALSAVVHSQVSTEGPSTQGHYSHFSLLRKLDGLSLFLQHNNIKELISLLISRKHSNKILIFDFFPTKSSCWMLL